MLEQKTQSVKLSKIEPHVAVSQLSEIEIQISRQDREMESNVGLVKYTVSMLQMLDNYTFSLGYNSASLVGIFITLLTSGKVRVEFGAYIERLVLVDEKKLMDYASAMTLYHLYFEAHDKQKEPNSRGNSTQHIMVQAPRRRR